MADRLDFAGLREEVEAATLLPEFELVTRRARYIRRRSRLAAVGSMLAILVILAPAGVAGAINRPTTGPAGLGIGLGPDQPEETITATATISTAPVPRTTILVAAVDGIDLAHTYALVDACLDNACDLQLVPLSRATQPVAGPIKVNLLRTKPTDTLLSITLRAQSERLMLVSARTQAGLAIFDQVDVGASAIRATDRGLWPVQQQSGAAVGGYNPKTRAVSALPSQPPVGNATVVRGVDAGAGIWTFGTQPGTDSGSLVVSASHDDGHTWRTAATGLPVTAGPVLASRDGTDGYLMGRVDTSYRLTATHDGGRSWLATALTMPWPDDVAPNAPYGLAVLPDARVLAWLTTADGVSYLESTDRGATFHPLSSAPAVGVYPVADGYVQLALVPKVSTDGATWQPAQLPYRVP